MGWNLTVKRGLLGPASFEAAAADASLDDVDGGGEGRVLLGSMTVSPEPEDFSTAFFEDDGNGEMGRDEWWPGSC